MLYAEVDRFAQAVTALVDGPHAEAVGTRLRAAVAEVRQLAGWTAFDSRRHGDAQRHLHAAEGLAVAAGDALLAARVRYCRARQLQHLRHNREAFDALQLARDHLGSAATPAVDAMLQGAQAASLAALGDGRAAHAALGRAEDSFGRIDLDREPEWMSFYDRGELLAQYGRVYRDLARADRRYGAEAVRWVTEAIREFGPHNVRSVVLNEVGLCSALILADEPEPALAAGTRAVDGARRLASPRIFDRLWNLRRDLVRHRESPAVAEFVRTLETVDPAVTQ